MGADLLLLILRLSFKLVRFTKAVKYFHALFAKYFVFVSIGVLSRWWPCEL